MWLRFLISDSISPSTGLKYSQKCRADVNTTQISLLSYFSCVTAALLTEEIRTADIPQIDLALYVSASSTPSRVHMCTYQSKCACVYRYSSILLWTKSNKGR